MLRRIMLAVAAPCLVVSSLSFGAASGTNLTLRPEAGNNGFCMDAKGDKKEDGTPVFIYKCHGRENQRWTVTQNQDGKAFIVGTGGLCLDVRGTHSKKDGTPVQLYKCHFGNNQKFTVEADGHIKEVESGKCLQAVGEKDGSAIVLDDCGNTKTEKWTFKN